MNSVSLIGSVTQDPSRTRTTTETTVAKFNLAVQRAQRNMGADFPSCTAFGKVGELIETYVHKGDRIGITGHIQTSSFETDGRKVYTTEVIVDRVEFLNSKEEKPEEATDGFAKITEEDIPFED